MAGINRKAVRDYERLCRDTGADAVLVIHRDTIIGEWYSQRIPFPKLVWSSFE